MPLIAEFDRGLSEGDGTTMVSNSAATGQNGDPPDLA
jgi:hypothetical protein